MLYWKCEFEMSEFIERSHFEIPEGELMNVQLDSGNFISICHDIKDKIVDYF